jgi:hypothetical protein
LKSDDYKSSQWQVSPNEIGAGVIGRPCPIGIVVFPRFEPGAETILERMTRAEALIELASHAFGFQDRSRAALDLLVEAVRPATCHRLTVGQLEAAVPLLVTLAGGSAAGVGLSEAR